MRQRAHTVARAHRAQRARLACKKTKAMPTVYAASVLARLSATPAQKPNMPALPSFIIAAVIMLATRSENGSRSSAPCARGEGSRVRSREGQSSVSCACRAEERVPWPERRSTARQGQMAPAKPARGSARRPSASPVRGPPPQRRRARRRTHRHVRKPPGARAACKPSTGCRGAHVA